MTDGRLLSFGSSWHTAGDPEPNPVPSLAFAPSCVGLDANHCTAAVLDVLNTHSDDAAIAGILIECTGTCTPKGGKARTRITFADGSEESHEWTYGPSG